MVRQEAAGLGRGNSVELHINYHCQYSQSLPWIIGINEQRIRSVQVFCASWEVKEDIKADGSCTGTNKPKKTTINLWPQFGAACTRLELPLTPTHLHQNWAITDYRGTSTIFSLRGDNPLMWFNLIVYLWLNPLLHLTNNIFWLIKWQTLGYHRKGVGFTAAQDTEFSKENISLILLNIFTMSASKNRQIWVVHILTNVHPWGIVW